MDYQHKGSARSNRYLISNAPNGWAFGVLKIEYARVSTREQNLDLQMDALKEVGAIRFLLTNAYQEQPWSVMGCPKHSKLFMKGGRSSSGS